MRVKQEAERHAYVWMSSLVEKFHVFTKKYNFMLYFAIEIHDDSFIMCSYSSKNKMLEREKL